MGPCLTDAQSFDSGLVTLLLYDFAFALDPASLIQLFDAEVSSPSPEIIYVMRCQSHAELRYVIKKLGRVFSPLSRAEYSGLNKHFVRLPELGLVIKPL